MSTPAFHVTALKKKPNTAITQLRYSLSLAKTWKVLFWQSNFSPETSSHLVDLYHKDFNMEILTTQKYRERFADQQAIIFTIIPS